MPGQDRSAVKLTYQDYCAIPEDGKRHEILDGEHHVSPAPRTDHQSVLGNLYAQLRSAIQDPGLGLVFLAPTDLQLSVVDIVQPDLMVILKANLPIITRTTPGWPVVPSPLHFHVRLPKEPPCPARTDLP